MKRTPHPDYLEYEKFIFNHKNYRGMPNNSPDIQWVSPKKTSLGLKRYKWWMKKKDDLVKRNILDQNSLISDIAKHIHPTKMKACQICGTKLSIKKIYLNNRFYKKISFAKNICKEKNPNIEDFINKIFLDKPKYQMFLKAFELTDFTDLPLKNLIKVFKDKKGFYLSPGAMSNAPDRFDGFHSDNLCCRSKSDKGRHKDNLRRYGEDRRAYELWSDGDWKLASFLMKAYNAKGLSPDHIGPLSLGFVHDPINLQPMTKRKNSAKGNRITKKDIKKLMCLEKAGNQIISWHSKYAWDQNKLFVENGKISEKKLQEILRSNLHLVLTILFELKNKNQIGFLEYIMNDQYALFDVSINSIEPFNYTKTKSNKGQYQNNAKRYKQKSLEALEEYKSKSNRRLADVSENKIQMITSDILKNLKDKGYKNTKDNFGKFLKN